MSELAWAAGLFEGEGSFCASLAKRRVDGSRLLRLQASLSMTTFESVYRFQRAVGGLGRTTPIRFDGNHQPQLQWTLYGDAVRVSLLPQLEAYLTAWKIDRFESALTRVRESVRDHRRAKING